MVCYDSYRLRRIPDAFDLTRNYNTYKTWFYDESASLGVITGCYLPTATFKLKILWYCLMNEVNVHSRTLPAAIALLLQDCSKEHCRTTEKRSVLQPAIFTVNPDHALHRGKPWSNLMVEQIHEGLFCWWYFCTQSIYSCKSCLKAFKWSLSILLVKFVTSKDMWHLFH